MDNNYELWVENFLKELSEKYFTLKSTRDELIKTLAIIDSRMEEIKKLDGIEKFILSKIDKRDKLIDSRDETLYLVNRMDYDLHEGGILGDLQSLQVENYENQTKADLMESLDKLSQKVVKLIDIVRGC